MDVILINEFLELGLKNEKIEGKRLENDNRMFKKFKNTMCANEIVNFVNFNSGQN